MNPGHYWTKREKEIIIEHYLKGDEHLQKLLPHRTIQAINSHRRLKLGINPNSKFWEGWEEEIIREHYLKGDKYLQSLLPNRSIPSIKQHRLNILKLKNHFYNKKSKVWRKNNENIIKDYVDNELGPAEISKKYGINLQTLIPNLKKAKTGKITVELVNGLPVDSLTTWTVGSSTCSVALRRRLSYTSFRRAGTPYLPI